MRLNTEKERNFYIDNCANGVWSVRELERNIKTDMYHRIGVILCTDNEETIVKYSVLNESKQIFASKYMTYLPTEEELSKELERNINFYTSR